MDSRVGEPALCRGQVHFSVPTGNFGDILAGFYAKRCGLPVATLIAATNSNSIVHRSLFTTRRLVETGRSIDNKWQ